MEVQIQFFQQSHLFGGGVNAKQGDVNNPVADGGSGGSGGGAGQNSSPFGQTSRLRCR